MKNLSQALVKFQSQLKPVNKESENPFFKSSYADLSSILQTVMPVLSANGLALVQPMRMEGDKTLLITQIIHESGEFIESQMILPQIQDPQKYGSLITYYKRYQLQAMLGIATKDEDDDANSVSQQPQQVKSNTNKPASDAQLKACYAISKKSGVEMPKITTFEEASLFIKKYGGK
jgi:hypothetical protein